jgi:predicted nucleic acid-binding protein
MRYVDTSIIVKLYVRETRSAEAATLVTSGHEAIPLTLFHQLEFANALRLKQFRGEADAGQIRRIFDRLQTHLDRGVYFCPELDWHEALRQAEHLSQTHTRRIGTRTLDLVHVASAMVMGANRFLTFDERQRNLAREVGLKTD